MRSRAVSLRGIVLETLKEIIIVKKYLVVLWGN